MLGSQRDIGKTCRSPTQLRTRDLGHSIQVKCTSSIWREGSIVPLTTRPRGNFEPTFSRKTRRHKVQSGAGARYTKLCQRDYLVRCGTSRLELHDLVCRVVGSK